MNQQQELHILRYWLLRHHCNGQQIQFLSFQKHRILLSHRHRFHRHDRLRYIYWKLRNFHRMLLDDHFLQLKVKSECSKVLVTKHIGVIFDILNKGPDAYFARLTFQFQDDEMAYWVTKQNKIGISAIEVGELIQ